MTELEQINQIISDSHKILIIQADNPDADSLASALALESIIHELGKEPVLYCGVSMPEYLKYLPGWDRVSSEVPGKFDASIIVDTSALSLLEKLAVSGAQGWVASRPVIVLDHHADVACDIPYASVVINDSDMSSTGELIYRIANELNWPVSIETAEFVMTTILSDTMGLTTETTRPDTYRAMAELVEKGVSRPKLEELRRAFNKMHRQIFSYKATLIERTEFFHDDALAIVTIPQQEINDYSPLYNPAPLIQPDHLQTEGVLVSLVMKSYDSGRITAAIRCNQGAPIAAKLAEHFGGGGHAHASGFKLEGKPLEEVESECISKVSELLSIGTQEV